MSRPFYGDAKTAKNVSFFPRRTLFSRDFSGTIEDTAIINTPLRPADVPFGGFVDIAPHYFLGEIPA